MKGLRSSPTYKGNLMFIKLTETDLPVLAINLDTSDAVEIHENKGKFLLMLSRELTPESRVKTTIQAYQTYELALADFEQMMIALASGQRV